MQGALKDARARVETLEGRLEEAEGSRGQADILKLQLRELEVGTVVGECERVLMVLSSFFLCFIHLC